MRLAIFSSFLAPIVRTVARGQVAAARPRDGAAPAPGVSAPSFPTAPSVQYHVHSQRGAISVDGSNRLVSLPDMQGLAALAAVAGFTAPTLMTDALGRKFLRFNGNEAAAIANALVMANRAYTVVMVGRSPHVRSVISVVMPRFAAYTSPTVNTAANASIGYLQHRAAAGAAYLTGSASPATTTNAVDCYKAIAGCQMQVMAVASRTTANGGTRLYINNDICDVAQQTNSVTGYIGAVVGGGPGASNTENLGVSISNAFDCYALAIWVGELSNAAADACVAAAVANYAIPQLDSNLVLDGDSITDGIATATGTSPVNHGALGTVLTNPGAELVPGNVRVINQGASGSQTGSLVTRRDAVDSVFASGKYPGGAAKNRVAVQIGRNDVAENGGKKNSAMLYADVVALINTVTTGYLQRGWSVTQVANIATTGGVVTTNVSPAGEDTLHKRLEGLRALIADTAAHTPLPQFLTDVLANTGQAYDGLVSVLHAYDITVSGATPFKTVVGSGQMHPTGPYSSDGTHLTAEGFVTLAQGGSTPQYGYGALI